MTQIIKCCDCVRGCGVRVVMRLSVTLYAQLLCCAGLYLPFQPTAKSEGIEFCSCRFVHRFRFVSALNYLFAYFNAVYM